MKALPGHRKIGRGSCRSTGVDGVGTPVHSSGTEGSEALYAAAQWATPHRARVLVHSLHALSSESFKNACFKLRQGNIESKTLDTKNFLKKLPLVVLTATRTRACGYIGPSRVSLKDSTKVEIRRVRECTHPQFVQYLIRSVPAFGRFALFSSSMVA